MIAVLNVGHTGCVGSIKIMLQSLGYEVVHLNDKAQTEMHSKYGIKPEISRTQLYFMGYDKPPVKFVGIEALKDCDLYVGIKEDMLDDFKKAFPDKKVLLFTINGGKRPYNKSKYPVVSANMYSPGFKCYIPFHNWQGFEPREVPDKFEAPVDFLHNAYMWGFGTYVDDFVKLGLKVYGDKGSPSGMVRQNEVKLILDKALCLLHLKASDSPGYAVYEAMANGVPVVLPQLFVDRMKYNELYINGETCYTFGAYAYRIENDDPDRPIETWFEPETHKRVVAEVAEILEKLKDPKENKRIGMNGHKKWWELTNWNEKKTKQLKEYFEKCGLV